MPNSHENVIERIRDKVVLFLQTLFAEESAPFRWFPQVATTEIVISGEKPEGLIKEHSKPFYSVDIGGIGIERRGIGDFVRMNTKTGMETYGNLRRYELRIICGSTAPGEVSTLAEALIWAFSTFRDVLQQSLRVTLPGGPVVGAETPLGQFSSDQSDSWSGRIFVQRCLAWETFDVLPDHDDPHAAELDEIRVKLTTTLLQ